MPIRVQNDLPVKEILEQENIFVMDEHRAVHQDIRPIRIGLLNLMPLKEETELQLLRSLSNTPLQVDVTFMAVESHEAKNTSLSHLNKFYETFTDIKKRKFDGMIITGAPVEVDVVFVNVSSHVSKNTSTSHLNKFYLPFTDIKDQKFDGFIITGAPVEQIPFEEVDYWKELTEIMEWTKTHVTSTLHLCWGAQAALYYHYGINKEPLEEKLFGVFWHKVLNRLIPAIRMCLWKSSVQMTGLRF